MPTFAITSNCHVSTSLVLFDNLAIFWQTQANDLAFRLDAHFIAKLVVVVRFGDSMLAIVWVEGHRQVKPIVAVQDG